MDQSETTTCTHSTGTILSTDNRAGTYTIACASCGKTVTVPQSSFTLIPTSPSDEHTHNYVNSVCTICGEECQHDYNEQSICIKCRSECGHERGKYIEDNKYDSEEHIISCDICGNLVYVKKDSYTNTSEHTHTWNEQTKTEGCYYWIEKTCTECGEVTSTTPVANHGEEVLDEDASLTEGNYIYVCKDCGETIRTAPKPAHSHDYTKHTDYFNLEENGHIKVGTCSCGKIEKTPEAHTFTDMEDIYCMSPSAGHIITYSCPCGETNTVHKAHNLDLETATSTKEGCEIIYTGECLDCGEPEAQIFKMDHGKEILAPELSTDTNVYICEDCGRVIKEELKSDIPCDCNGVYKILVEVKAATLNSPATYQWLTVNNKEFTADRLIDGTNMYCTALDYFKRSQLTLANDISITLNPKMYNYSIITKDK